MVNSELLQRTLFLFSELSPDHACIWIRNAGGTGAVSVPCEILGLEGVLEGDTYRVVAPGVDCEIAPSTDNASGTVEINLHRPGGAILSWNIGREKLESASRSIKQSGQRVSVYA
jgi:hypothetical protein